MHFLFHLLISHTCVLGIFISHANCFLLPFLQRLLSLCISHLSAGIAFLFSPSLSPRHPPSVVLSLSFTVTGDATAGCPLVCEVEWWATNQITLIGSHACMQSHTRRLLALITAVCRPWWRQNQTKQGTVVLLPHLHTHTELNAWQENEFMYEYHFKFTSIMFVYLGFLNHNKMHC